MVKQIARLIESLGYVIQGITLSRTRSVYYHTNKGVIRLADHERYTVKYGKPIIADIRPWMKESTILAILLSYSS
jgi:hypothetical protein